MSIVSDYIVSKGYIPWFKSQIIRMGILDLLGGYGPGDLIKFLDSQMDLGGDLQALRRVAEVGNDRSKPIDVGESGTIYRFVRFYLWKYGIDQEIVMGGTLTKRAKEMGATPEIIHWPLAKLLTLEGGTTQWATMAILMGNKETLREIPFYIQQTYDAIEHWEKQRKCGMVWVPQRDPTLIAQVEGYASFLKTGKINIQPTRLGDCDLACFLMAFGVLTPEEAKEIWPQIQFHESDRMLEMTRTAREILRRGIIHTNDHRVAHANAMLLRYLNPKISIYAIKQKFSNPDCVNKTWPRFWDLLADMPNILQLS